MKALFLIFHGFDEANGISKKIRYQVKALKDCGLDVRTCYYDVSSGGNRRWMTDDKILTDFGSGTSAKLRKRFDFSFIANYVSQEKITLVYIRSFHNANPFTIRMVKQLKHAGAKVVMEIPTYPYDQEYVTRFMKLELAVDRCFRHSLVKKMDGVITFSDAREIFGKQTIRISNGIDFDAVPVKQHINDTSSELHLIGVAEVHYWHGFDRIISGLAEYYQIPRDYKVYFHVVGALSGERERQEILPLIKQYQLEPYVILHGAHRGEALDQLFEDADFAIGSLGRHRSGITNIKTLKNREYAARGFAFVYSETDSDFDNRPYVLKAPADESPIDIENLIIFYRHQQFSPNEIRSSIKETLSWQAQMQTVLNELLIKN